MSVARVLPMVSVFLEFGEVSVLEVAYLICTSDPNAGSTSHTITRALPIRGLPYLLSCLSG